MLALSYRARRSLPRVLAQHHLARLFRAARALLRAHGAALLLHRA